MKKKASRSREYLVTSSIARAETYRITARSEDEAEELAYIDGEFVETGETFHIDQLEIREEPRQKSRARRARRDKRAENATFTMTLKGGPYHEP